METKTHDLATKVAKSPLAVMGGLAGGSTVIGLLVSMGISNGDLLASQADRIDHMERRLDSALSTAEAERRRHEIGIANRLRPLELEAAKGDRFTGRDGEAIEKRIEAMEQALRWRGQPGGTPH